MVKRTGGLLLVLLLLAGSCRAELRLFEKTPAQKMLKTYLTNVNEYLLQNGEEEINKIFDQQNTVVELGITATNDAELPEGITITVYLNYGSIHYLLLRVNDAARFPRIAAAFRQALAPLAVSAEEAIKVPAARAAKAMQNPADSFEDQAEEEKLQGTAPREFYAYYPNQYHDMNNWMQLMIIFPMEGFWDEERGIISGETGTKPPPSDEGQDEGYEGYNPSDDYTHLETFTTPTPEPDSAAAEYDDFD